MERACGLMLALLVVTAGGCPGGGPPVDDDPPPVVGDDPPPAAGDDPPPAAGDDPPPVAGDAPPPVVGDEPPQLPGIGGDADCDQALPAPSLCAWATSLDALVVGELTAVELLVSPAEKATAVGEWELVDENACREFVNPGLLLTVAVEQTLRGQPPAVVQVRLGSDHAELLSPHPERGPDGALTWSPSETSEPLAVGQLVGLPLHHVNDDSTAGEDVWSLMGELMFSTADDTITFQGTGGDCFEPAPTGADGASLEALLTAVEACDDLEGRARRAQVRRTWGPDGATPSRWMAGQCTDPIPTSATECSVSADCPTGELCSAGSCG